MASKALAERGVKPRTQEVEDVEHRIVDAFGSCPERLDVQDLEAEIRDIAQHVLNAKGFHRGISHFLWSRIKWPTPLMLAQLTKSLAGCITDGLGEDHEDPTLVIQALRSAELDEQIEDVVYRIIFCGGQEKTEDDLAHHIFLSVCVRANVISPLHPYPEPVKIILQILSQAVWRTIRLFEEIEREAQRQAEAAIREAEAKAGRRIEQRIQYTAYQAGLTAGKMDRADLRQRLAQLPAELRCNVFKQLIFLLGLPSSSFENDNLEKIMRSTLDPLCDASHELSEGPRGKSMVSTRSEADMNALITAYGEEIKEEAAKCITLATEPSQWPNAANPNRTPIPAALVPFKQHIQQLSLQIVLPHFGHTCIPAALFQVQEHLHKLTTHWAPQLKSFSLEMVNMVDSARSARTYKRRIPGKMFQYEATTIEAELAEVVESMKKLDVQEKIVRYLCDAEAEAWSKTSPSFLGNGKGEDRKGMAAIEVVQEMMESKGAWFEV